jgi:hypothetical protein
MFLPRRMVAGKSVSLWQLSRGEKNRLSFACTFGSLFSSFYTCGLCCALACACFEKYTSTANGVFLGGALALAPLLSSPLDTFCVYPSTRIFACATFNPSGRFSHTNYGPLFFLCIGRAFFLSPFSLGSAACGVSYSFLATCNVPLGAGDTLTTRFCVLSLFFTLHSPIIHFFHFDSFHHIIIS